MKYSIGILIGSFVFFGSAYGQSAKPVDTIQLKPVQVAPHSYFVQGFPEMGSSANQNFISNAGFVVTLRALSLLMHWAHPFLRKS